MLALLSVVISLLIVGFGVFEGRRWFGAYRHSVARLEAFADKLRTCSEGLSFMEVARGWLNEPDTATRTLARSLLRHFEKEPITVHQRLGWVVDVELLCDGKAQFKAHPATIRVEAMPGLLMGAGILFTFLGLTAGVYGLDPTNADRLTEGVKQLLGGMSLAFLTSIAGVGAALWWTLTVREAGARFEAAYAGVADLLLDKTFILMPEEMNYQILEDLRRQAKALEHLEPTLDRSLQRLISAPLFQELRASIAELSRQHQSLEQIGALKDIHRELKALTQILAQQSESQGVMGSVLKRLLQQRDELLKAGAVGPSYGSFAGDGAAVSSPVQFVADSMKLVENFRGVHESQETAIRAMNESAEQLTQMMKAARLANADIIKVHGALLVHLENLEKHWSGYRSQLESMQQVLATTLTGFQGELHDALKRVHGEFDGLLAQGLDHFAGAIEGFQTTLQGLSNVLQHTPEDKTKSGFFGKMKP